MEYPVNFKEILDLLKTLSFQAMGYSSPNPPVACVITDLDGKILSSGSTQKVGQNHAEREAYQSFAQKYSNSKNIPHLVFVTLEPCSHFGKTPPCIDLILENKPDCVYYGLSDPNPLVRKRNGLQECKEKGIKVRQSPEIAKISEAFLSGFITRVEKNRPQIFLKSALSREGYYSDVSKSKISLSNPISNQVTQVLRAKFDAVVVGPVTIYIDDPGLDFRGIDLPEVKVPNFLVHKELDENKSKTIFTETVFRELFSLKAREFHNSQISEYQPFRVFVMSMKKIPNLSFFQKQGLLNEKLGSKKVLFFLLDYDLENSSHQKLYQKISAISHDLPVVVNDKNLLLQYLLGKFAELSLNTVLVEGGNLLYRIFSEDLQSEDMIYFIHTDKSIPEGIFPEIQIANKEKKLTIEVESDLWEVYGG